MVIIVIGTMVGCKIMHFLKFSHLFAAAVLLTLPTLPLTSAASFDCAKASAARERIICGDKALSDLDSMLDHVYKERRALLSPNGVEQLQRSELSWLRYIAIICPMHRPPIADSSWTSQRCLQGQYRMRLDQLSKVAQKSGPFVFSRIDIFDAKPVTDGDDNTGHTTGFFTQHASYPQIDNLSTPTTEAWNKHAVKTISNDPTYEEDADIDYDIEYASDRLTSIVWSSVTYGHGAAHGMGSGSVENLVLNPSLRELKASDIFGDDNRWLASFQTLVWDDLRRQGWNDSDDRQDPISANILAVAVNSTRWAFTTSGIRIVFSDGDGGCFACAPRQTVILGWNQLRTFLIPGSPTP